MRSMWHKAIFKRSALGFNSEISFSSTGCFSKIKEPKSARLFTHSWLGGGNGLVTFAMSWAWSEMLIKLSRIWTLNSKFSSRLIAEPTLENPDYHFLPIVGGRRDRLIPFPLALLRTEAQTASSRIWTLIADFISKTYNHFTKWLQSEIAGSLLKFCNFFW